MPVLGRLYFGSNQDVTWFAGLTARVSCRGCAPGSDVSVARVPIGDPFHARAPLYPGHRVGRLGIEPRTRGSKDDSEPSHDVSDASD